MGIFVWDLARMERFYVDVMGLTVTDRGRGIKFPVDYVFMSAEPDQHHQFVICTGRPADAAFSVVFQMSFKVGSLAELRRFHAVAERLELKKLRPINHGNALSVYFEDPEGNMLEIYLDTEHHVAQPHYHPLDFSMSDEAIWADTAAHVAADATYAPREAWIAAMAEQMGLAPHEA